MTLKALTIKYTAVLLVFCSFYFLYLSNVDTTGETVRLAEPSDVSPLHLSCECATRHSPSEALNDQGMSSTCDRSATVRGDHQKVISYSLSGKNLERALKNIETNAESVSIWLPRWLIRVYHNLDMTHRSEALRLCTIWCKYPGVDFCQVSHLPPPLLDQSNVSSSIWKFLVLGDPLVDRFMVSDVNSLIGETDVATINQWIKSNVSWTFMRYHPIYHTLPALLGVLGGVNDNRSLTIDLRSRLIDGQTLMLDKQSTE